MKIVRKVAVAVTATATLAGATSASWGMGSGQAAQEMSVSASVQDTHRLAGADRYATSVAVSKHLYPSGSEVAFVASGEDFPDALTGGAGATHAEGPVLLTKSTGPVPNVVVEELERLNPEEIVVLGGAEAVSPGTVTALEDLAPTSRIDGKNRYETAARVADLWSSAPTVYVASGLSYPDALAGGAAAAHQDAPVLLAHDSGLPQATEAALGRLDPTKIVLLGGSVAVPKSVTDEVKSVLPGASVTRYAGNDRYATAQAVADKVWPSGSDEAFYATGLGFADALSGVRAAAAHSAPLLLVKTACAPATTRAATQDLGVLTEYILGGEAAIKDGATTASCGAVATDSVLAVLDDVAVKGRAPKTGYDRDEFGPSWTDDVDVQGGHNGCDTRNDILRRDLVNRVFKAGASGCVVQTGTLKDPFTGTNMAFERGETSHLVHIDHLVALADAWQKGAQQLTTTERRNFANDPLNLWAVNGTENMSKSDGDAATWLPPNKPIRCDYVAYQTAVKDKYGLWMTQAEKEAISNIITTSCPGKKIPTSNDVPALGR